MTLDRLTPRDLFDIALRRKWVVLGCVLVTIVLSWIICLVLPKSYRSSTLILVENQKIPENYVSAVVGGTVAERLTAIKQQVLSRSVLSQVIDEFNLAPKEKGDAQRESVIERLRKTIQVETKSAPGSVRIDSFSISYAHSDPLIAQKVTAKLASQFIEGNLKAREQLVEGTTEFLNAELERAKKSLEEQEHAIAAFKKKYMGELPGQTEANLQTLNRLQKDLTDINQAIQTKMDRRVALQKMIHSYEVLGMVESLQMPGEPDLPEQPKSTTPSLGVGANRGSSKDPLVGRLRELQRTLTSLSAEYKDTYPDIIQIKQEIAQIKAQLAEQDEQNGTDKTDKPSIPEPGKPKAQAKAKAPKAVVDPYTYELKKELEENELGLQGLKEQQRRLTAQIHEYEVRVERAPEREQELIVLQRDYDNTKKHYQALLEKQLNARISENLEKHQKGEKFRILDPAHLPTEPESPDVLKIMLAGLVLGCGLGYGSAFALEYVSGVIRKPEDAERMLGLPVLATIPHLRMAYEMRIGTLTAGSAAQQAESLRPAIPGKTDSGSSTQKALHPWRRIQPKKDNGSATGTASESVKLELNLVAKWRPTSLVTEQFRVAATRLVLLGSNQKSMVVVVTSAVKGEGKSTAASNLAYVLAQDLGKSTVLIDCDFKQPMLHAYYGISSKPGLAEAIYGDLPLDACLQRNGDSLLYVLTCGRRDHRLVDLTKIPQVRNILAELQTRFEFIILDAPPILPLADMNLLASMADMLLVVVRAGVTPQDVVEKAVKTLKPFNRAGIILTGYEAEWATKYMHQYYITAQGGYYK